MTCTFMKLATLTMTFAATFCTTAQASGRVVYKVEVKGPQSIWLTFDTTVDDPRGALLGYRSALVIGGREVAALAKPSQFRMAMGQVKTFPLQHVVPSRATLRGRGYIVVEFYLEGGMVYKAIIPFANGRYVKRSDGCTVRAP